jgi:dGTPase
VLKYDSPIPAARDENDKVTKGYYLEDQPIVTDIKSNIAPSWFGKEKFKTVECSIMDIADDIAYSTYDLEDSFKAGFLNPSKILSSDPDLLHRVARKVRAEINLFDFSATDVLGVFLDLFEDHFVRPEDLSPQTRDSKAEVIFSSLEVASQLDNIAANGHLRTQFTSDLVGKFISGVSIEQNYEFPQLSKAIVDKNTLIKIETLKNYSFEATIRSSRVKISEYRGKDIVAGIFKALSAERGHLLLPEDVMELFRASEGSDQRQKRIICDFIAGMTDRYAVEFYGRLYSDGGQTMFKPL